MPSNPNATSEFPPTHDLPAREPVVTLPCWRAAQAAELAAPSAPTPWGTFTWGDNSHQSSRDGPEPKPTTWRPQYRHVNIRVQDPDRLLRYRPPTPDSDDSSPESYAHVSHFTGGNAVTARARVRDPLAPFPDQHMHVTVAIDTYSDISVAHADIAFNIAPITEIVRTGGG